MNKTPNYQLNQWVKSDQVKMEDFNADNAKIDTAIKAEANARSAAVQSLQRAVDGKARIAVGTYTGNDAENRVISLPFTPKAVLVLSDGGYTAWDTEGYRFGGLALENAPVVFRKYSNYVILSITTNGFVVHCKYLGGYDAAMTNGGSYTYHYIAFA